MDFLGLEDLVWLQRLGAAVLQICDFVCSEVLKTQTELPGWEGGFSSHFCDTRENIPLLGGGVSQVSLWG